MPFPKIPRMLKSPCLYLQADRLDRSIGIISEPLVPRHFRGPDHCVWVVAFSIVRWATSFPYYIRVQLERGNDRRKGTCLRWVEGCLMYLSPVLTIKWKDRSLWVLYYFAGFGCFSTFSISRVFMCNKCLNNSYPRCVPSSCTSLTHQNQYFHGSFRGYMYWSHTCWSHACSWVVVDHVSFYYRTFWFFYTE